MREFSGMRRWTNDQPCGIRTVFFCLNRGQTNHVNTASNTLKMFDYFIQNVPLLIEGGALGFCVGILTGLFGAGGGFIITPALNIFLSLPMNVAVGTSACQVLGAAGFSLYHHLDRKLFGIRVALLMAIGIPFGAFLGGGVINRFQSMGDLTVFGTQVKAVNFILLLIFAIFLTVITSWLLFDNFWLRRGKDDDEHNGFFQKIKIPPLVKFRTIPAGEFSAVILVVLGLIMGFLSGLLGIGGGVIMMPMLFYLVGQETKFAAQTSTMLIFISGFFATITHIIHHNVHYLLVVFLVFGAFFGTRIGAKIQKRTSGKSIRKYFAFVVLGAVIMVWIKLVAMIR